MIQQVGSRGKLLSKYRKVSDFKEEDVRNLEMVTTDEDRVLRGCWAEIKSQR